MRILACIWLILTLFVDKTNGATPLLAIKLNNTVAPQYCNEPVTIAENLTIEGAFTITGMKISIGEGYKVGEDELAYSGSIGNIVGRWNSTQGNYILNGDATTTTENYREAIKSVKYKNNLAIPTLGIRKISITLEDADYLEQTGHFYQYIPKPGISWMAARDEAAATLYHGLLRGYLATITSQYESDFIKIKTGTNGIGWIGASDAAAEGDWRWVTGLEGLEDGGKGRLFWKGTGYQAKTNPSSFGPVKDAFGVNAYFNWNKWDIPYSSILPATNWEPNQSGDEDYAHITVFPKNANDSYKWNDLPNVTSTSGDYASKGYLIEYGGMPEDPPVQLSATLELQVNTMLFNTDPIPAICEGMGVKLNIQNSDWGTIPGIYSWEPTANLSMPLNQNPATEPNPIASPKTTTTYTLTGTRGSCSGTSKFTVTVNPLPVSLLVPEENICQGQSITLDPGEHAGYDWGSNIKTRTITVNKPGTYSVKLMSGKNCTSPLSNTKVNVYEYPAIGLSQLQKLICGDAKATNVDITPNTDYSFVSADGKATVNGLNVTVPADGIYPMKFTAIHQYCPSYEDFNLAFFKNPKGVLTVDGRMEGQRCFGYNLNAIFTPEGDLTRADYTWEFGGENIANGIGLNTQVIPLGIIQYKRDLKLTVSQDGCPATFIQPEIMVIPNLDLRVNENLGCEPLDVVFTALSEGAVSYAWDFGDEMNIIGSTFEQMHTYEKANTYDVKLKVTTIEQCNNEVKIPKMVFVAPIPDVKFSLSPTECLEPEVNELFYTGAIGTDEDRYLWYLDNVVPSAIITETLTKNDPFKFDLRADPTLKIGLQVISKFECKSEKETIILRRKPGFSVIPSSVAGCIPFEPSLSGVIKDQADVVDFSWDFGDGASGTGPQVTHTWNQPDKNYTITVSGMSSLTGCSDTLVHVDLLRTYPKPNAEFSIDNAIVYNDKPDVNFTDRSEGATSWLWDFGDGTTSEDQNPFYHFAKMGSQSVLLKVANDDLCTDTISHTVLVAFDRLFPPNGFSPNAPNDIDREFKLNSEGITSEGYHFTILSRWNDVVFEVKNEIKGWDGRMGNGSLAPAGAYMWILNFTDFLGRRHRQTGTVTLVY